MKTIDRRLSKLEHRFGIANTKTTYVVVLMDAGSELGTAQEAYIKMLQETEVLHPGTFGVVDLRQIPDGRNAEETERFVRESADKICGSRNTQRSMLPVLNVVLDRA
jgi:hypothetical protein